MSFDVFAQSFRDGESVAGDITAARAVVMNEFHKHDSQFGVYNMEFTDGSILAMYADGLDGKKPFMGVMFALRGASDVVGNFMFRFALAARFVLLPAMEPACVLLTNDDQARHLPPAIAKEFQIITVASGGELLAALKGGHDAWRTYRDKTVGDARDGQ